MCWSFWRDSGGPGRGEGEDGPPGEGAAGVLGHRNHWQTPHCVLCPNVQDCWLPQSWMWGGSVCSSERQRVSVSLQSSNPQTWFLFLRSPSCLQTCTPTSTTWRLPGSCWSSGCSTTSRSSRPCWRALACLWISSSLWKELTTSSAGQCCYSYYCILQYCADTASRLLKYWSVFSRVSESTPSMCTACPPWWRSTTPRRLELRLSSKWSIHCWAASCTPASR